MYRYVIIEDEALSRQSTILKIESSGLPFTFCGEAETAVEGIALLQKEMPDLAILDYHMPGESGTVVLQRIRELGLPVKLILASGYSDFSFAHEGIISGVIAYLLKPFSEEELSAALQNALALLGDGEEADEEESVAQKMKRYMQTHYAQSLTLSSLAGMFSHNASYLSTLFRKETGVNFNAYLTSLRLEKAKERLAQSSASIASISKQTGFDDYKYFCRLFKQQTGVTPSEYRTQSRTPSDR